MNSRIVIPLLTWSMATLSKTSFCICRVVDDSCYSNTMQTGSLCTTPRAMHSQMQPGSCLNPILTPDVQIYVSASARWSRRTPSCPSSSRFVSRIATTGCLSCSTSAECRAVVLDSAKAYIFTGPARRGRMLWLPRSRHAFCTNRFVVFFC